MVVREEAGLMVPETGDLDVQGPKSAKIAMMMLQNQHQRIKSARRRRVRAQYQIQKLRNPKQKHHSQYSSRHRSTCHLIHYRHTTRSHKRYHVSRTSAS